MTDWFVNLVAIPLRSWFRYGHRANKAPFGRTASQPCSRYCSRYLYRKHEGNPKNLHSYSDETTGRRLIVITDTVGRSIKAQMKYANKIGAKLVSIFGDSEIEIINLM